MKIALASLFLVMSLGLSVASSSVPTDPARFHLQLDSAHPYPDSTVVAPVAEIRLFFSQPPQLAPSSIRVVRADDTLVEMEKVAAQEGDAAVLYAPLAGETPAGTYRVVWRTMAADGHVVDGDYLFRVRSAEHAERR